MKKLASMFQKISFILMPATRESPVARIRIDSVTELIATQGQLHILVIRYAINLANLFCSTESTQGVSVQGSALGNMKSLGSEETVNIGAGAELRSF